MAAFLWSNYSAAIPFPFSITRSTLRTVEMFSSGFFAEHHEIRELAWLDTAESILCSEIARAVPSMPWVI